MYYMQFWIYSSFQNISPSSYVIGLMIPLTKARNVDNRALYAQSRYVLILEYSVISSRRRGTFFAYFTLITYGSIKNSNSKCQLHKISHCCRVKNWIRVIRDFRLPPRSIWDRPSLGYYAAYSGNSLQTFRDNLSVQLSKVNKFLIFWHPEQSYYFSVQEEICGSRAKY